MADSKARSLWINSAINCDPIARRSRIFRVGKFARSFRSTKEADGKRLICIHAYRLAYHSTLSEPVGSFNYETSDIQCRYTRSRLYHPFLWYIASRSTFKPRSKLIGLSLDAIKIGIPSSRLSVKRSIFRQFFPPSIKLNLLKGSRPIRACQSIRIFAQRSLPIYP